MRAAPTSFPQELAQRFANSQSVVQSQTFLSEIEAFLSVDSQQVEAERRSFGDLPLIILTRTQRSTNFPADQAETEWSMWNRMHDGVARLSMRGSNRLVPDSGHYIQLDQPQAVIDAVAEVVAAARHSRARPH